MNPMRQQRGFNLVELMIGLTISLMGLAAVASMMMTFSKNRGSVAQTQAAQDNGVMALYRLERDVGQAGYGLMDLQGCTPTIVNGDGTNPSFAVLPISIGFVGAGVSDTILVQGTNPVSGIPGTELSSPTAGGNTMTSSRFYVRSSLGFNIDDRVVTNALAPDCTLVTVTAIDQVAAAGPVPAHSIISFTPALSASALPGFLANFGPGVIGGRDFFSRRYAIGLTGLTVADFPAYTTSNLVDNIVFMKAQYGLADTASSTTVTRWVSGATLIDNTNVQRVIALRVGVVARSTKREDAEIDQPNPLPLFDEKADSAGGTDAVSFTIPDMNIRYRAYSTIIPLKNVIWTR
ncbi:MAG: PilW family protein [Rhodocyclaceae bacterium]|nr:PilW family protein [Rhodocyclaceae bacterium]